MEAKEVLKEFILEFVPIGYSLTPQHSCGIGHFADVLQLLFKKKFEMVLTKNGGFTLELLYHDNQ